MVVGIAVGEDRRGTIPVTATMDRSAEKRRYGRFGKRGPGRLLVLGGGAVGVEMAQAFNRLGCWEVVVLEGADRLLAREEPFAGEELRAVFEAEASPWSRAPG